MAKGLTVAVLTSAAISLAAGAGNAATATFDLAENDGLVWAGALSSYTLIDGRLSASVSDMSGTKGTWTDYSGVAGWVLLAGIGGMAAMKRRKRNA